MAKRVIYSRIAQSDRKSILLYWASRNKSKTYSNKLFILFKEAVSLISGYPQMGKPTQMENIRIKIVRDYLIVYEIRTDHIIILTIFDSRRDPEELKKIVGGT